MNNLKGHMVLVAVAVLGVSLILVAILLPPGDPPLPEGEQGESQTTTSGEQTPRAEAQQSGEQTRAVEPIEPMDEPAHVRLLRAASAGDVATMDSLIGMGVSPDTAASMADVGSVASPELEAGATALILAARDSDARTVNALLEAGADPNAQTDSGMNALMHAAQRGETDTVVSLLGAGADPTLETTEGRTALMLAARSGAHEAASLLLEAGTDPNTADADGATALMHAASGQHLNAVIVLLSSGARVDLADSSGRGAIERAGESGPIADVLREAAGG